ncbi:MAG TPA: MBL fold metallo-hydrolase [Gemmatimonadaceae bacterium]|nr:MBL fold metallo-hydrolase [Gemmatimonadaceae bacterium]
MKVWVLGSGSSGNAVLVECGESRVLVDAGFGTRMLSMRLKAIGVAPASIEACIVTHEHTDHVKGAAAGARKWGWALYASAGTMDAWPELRGAGCSAISPEEPLALSRLEVTTKSTPHDAASPIGVRLACRSTGATAVVCTDIGHVSENVRSLCAGADLLVLESNHDEGMLRTGPYPPFLQRRIASRTGHLSNRASAELARDLVHRDLAHVVLAHLSEKCNDHGIARAATAEALRRTRFRGTLSVALQHGVVGPFLPRAGRAEPEAQYSLAL